MVLPLIAVAIGGVAIVGVGLGVVLSMEPEETTGEKVRTTFIRVGYVTEGVVKGAIIAIPTSMLVLIAFNQVMKVQKMVAE
tara:strand:- start:101 stop:343 length:243 start_codon:yes stop_codon:yes gene_type:complete